MQENINKLALDIGNGKIKFIHGELSTEQLRLRVLDYLEVPSEGIKRSVVEDPDLLIKCIKETLRELESRNGRDYDKVSIGISNDRIISKTDHGYLEFDEEKEITQADMDALINQVKNEILDSDEMVIEQEAYNVRVNNSGILKTPIGQIGKNIQGDIHLITIKKEYLTPIIDVVNRAGLEVEDVFLNASSSAKATLEQEDRQMGVALIDIGEGATDIAIYKNDKIIYTKSLSIGGMHYVNDISYLLKIQKKEAKEILEKLKLKDYKDGKIKTSKGEYEIKKIKDIIDARTGDLITFITKTIEDSGFNGYLGKGLAFTGGAISIDEIFSKVGSKMECAVRKVKPFPLKGLEKTNPSMSTVIGILLTKLETEYNRQEEKRDDITTEEETPQAGPTVEEETENIFVMNGLTESDFIQKYDEEEDEEEEKEGAFQKIKQWISNFI